MGTPYEKDVVAWAMEQAALLRSGQLSALDIEHIAEEIEDVWAAAGFPDTLLRRKIEPEVIYGNETAVQPRVQG